MCAEVRGGSELEVDLASNWKPSPLSGLLQIHNIANPFADPSCLHVGKTITRRADMTAERHDMTHISRMLNIENRASAGGACLACGHVTDLGRNARDERDPRSGSMAIIDNIVQGLIRRRQAAITSVGDPLFHYIGRNIYFIIIRESHSR